MNCLIVEDEPHAAEHLTFLLRQCEQNLEEIVWKDSVKQAVNWLRKNKPDLCFFDIQLGDGLAFSIFENVEIHSPIVFTTAYDTYALAAFKENSIGYLLKPVNLQELEDVLKKYNKFNMPTPELIKQFNSYQSRFLVQAGQHLRWFNADEIACFTVRNRFVFLTTLKGESFLFDSPLDTLESKLDPHSFFRINRQYILSINAIGNMRLLNRGRILIEPKPPLKEEPIVSIERATMFRNWLNR